MVVLSHLNAYSALAVLVHAALYFRKQIWTQARRSLREQPDIHARLMSKYRQGLYILLRFIEVILRHILVPEWWYLVIFLTMFTLGVIDIEVWPT